VFKIVDERCIFNKKDPYILGIDVLEGTLKLGTPVVIPNKAWTGDAKTQDQSTDTIEFGQVCHVLCLLYPSMSQISCLCANLSDVFLRELPG
jgi:translation initiation factor IF-2